MNSREECTVSVALLKKVKMLTKTLSQYGSVRMVPQKRTFTRKMKCDKIQWMVSQQQCPIITYFLKNNKNPCL